MGRRKQSIGRYRLSAGFACFTGDEIKKLFEIIGQELTADFILSLTEELNGWLVRFGDFKSVRYGRAERRMALRAQKNALSLVGALDELGEVARLELENVGYRQGITDGQVLKILKDIGSIADRLEAMSGPEIHAPALLVHAVWHCFERHDLAPTVSHDPQGASYRPSRFVRTIDFLMKVDQRLAVYDPIGANYWANLSQWVSARLYEEAEFENLTLLRRPKLNADR